MIGSRGVPAASGGIEKVVEQLGAALARRGHEVTVFCRSNYVNGGGGTYAGMRRRVLPTIGTKHLDAIAHTSLSTVEALTGFDVLHYHALGPGLLAPLPRLLSRRTAVVQTVHAVDWQRAKWGAVARCVLRSGELISTRAPHELIVPSVALADHYRSRHRKEPTVIPNPFPGIAPRPAETITTRWGLEPRRYVLFVGRLTPEKQVDVLLRAYRLLGTDHRLVIVGGSSFTDSYVAQLGQLARADDRVTMTGALHGEVLEEVFTNAAVFVSPSAVEGFNITLVEAISAGLPIVASDIGPHVELLTPLGEAAHLHAVGDEQGLARAISQALRRPGYASDALARYREVLLEDFSPDRIARLTEDVYRRALARTHRGETPAAAAARAEALPPTRRLVVLSPYAVAPPRHGPAIRIAGLLGNLGEHWQVEHFSQAIQRSDLPWPRLTVQGGPRWTEHRLRDPISWAWVIGLGMVAHYPAAFADRVLALLPRRRIRAALSQADAVLVTPHNQFGWVQRHTPQATGIVVDVHCIEADLWPPRHARWTHRIAAELRRSERLAFATADACFVTCEADAQTVRGFGVREVTVVPNGVDATRFRPAASEDERRQARRQIGEPEDGLVAIFVGSAGIANQSAIPVLERQAAEYARAGIRILVAGRIGAGRPSVPNVRWAGEVDDVSVWLRAADLAICPTLEGSGTSLKSVEYLAAGLPIVSTPVGMRGLCVTDGVHAVICEADLMPQAAAALVADPARMRALGDAGRRLALEAFSWQKAGQAATEVLDRMAERRDALLAGDPPQLISSNARPSPPHRLGAAGP